MLRTWLSKSLTLGYLLLAMALFGVSGAQAGSPKACTDLFLSYKVSGQHRYTSPIESSGRLEDALYELRAKLPDDQSLQNYMQIRERIGKFVRRLSDPYQTEHTLATVSGKRIYNEIYQLTSILSQRSTDPHHSREINAWVRSDAHAIVLYQVLSDLGLSNYQPTLDALIRSNPYFRSVHRPRGPPGSLITFSFEKEGTNKEIGLLYRDPRMTDDEWLALSDDQRISRLTQLLPQRKKFQPAAVIAPTALKPEFLSGYSEELDSATKKNYGWEISHKNYEINLERMMGQIRETAALFKETHSIHAHVVFELPENYSHTRSFNDWIKEKNDALYVRGLEEGLHGNELTGLVRPRKNQSWLKRLKELFEKKPEIDGPQFELPRRLSEVNFQSHKFWSMGLRADIYGSATQPGYRKFGLELRDTTRDLAALEKYLREVTRDVEGRVWERRSSKTDRPLDTEKTQALLSLMSFLKPEIAEKLYLAADTVGLPFIDFESGHFWRSGEGQMISPNPQKVKTLREARTAYRDSLLKMQEEILASKEDLGEENIRMAIQMTLTEWAQSAKLSELY